MPGPPIDSLALLARMDIYLIDQLLRGRIAQGCRILDAGCGRGRNIAYFMARGFEVWGVDTDLSSVEEVRALAAWLQPDLSAENFQCSPVEAVQFEAESFDVVISNAVLHFASDSDQFDRMVEAMWRVVAPGGMLFARLATKIGIEERIAPRSDPGWFDLPDGSSRFLVDETRILETTERLSGVLADPLKTTLVQNLRSMTTWVLNKPVLSEPLDGAGRAPGDKLGPEDEPE